MYKPIPPYDTSKWLYPENEQFLRGTLQMPVNRPEITYNFKLKYNINDSPLWQRLGCAIILFGILLVTVFWCTGIFSVSLNMIQGDYSLSDYVSLLIIGVFTAPFSISFILWLIKTIATLPVNYYNRINDDWHNLLNHGQILDGAFESIPGGTLKYTFTNPKGESVIGVYRPINSPFKWSQSVRVWYVDDKLHTLL